MGLLLLVRHGQASMGTADYDRLSGLGRRQAAALGRRLGGPGVRVDRVVHGSLVRQRDTAAELLAVLPAPVDRLTDDARLDEYDHDAVFAARPSSVDFATEPTPENQRAVQAALDGALAAWMHGDGSGYREAHDAFLARALAAVDALTALPGTTLAVSSGGVIAVTAARALGLPAGRWPDLARILVNTGLTKLITGATGTHLLTFNDHAHLEHDRSWVTYR